MIFRKPRFVIDTNVWLSRLLWPESVSSCALSCAHAIGSVLMSEGLYAEVVDVLSRKKFDRYLTAAERREFLIVLCGMVEFSAVSCEVQICRDPDDDKVLALAVSGNADAIITGDRDLLVLDPFQSIAILSPREFLEKF